MERAAPRSSTLSLVCSVSVAHPDPPG